MVVLFYIAAAALLFAGFIADSPFTSTDLIVLAAVCFLLARFIRIERRLDKIEGVERESKTKRALTWARANRTGVTTVGQIAVFIACLWFSWGWITQSAGEDWAAISPKSPHPSLHAFFGASPMSTAVLVWFPIGALMTFLILGLVAFYVVGVAILVGIWPRKWLKAASSVPRNSRPEQIVGFGLTVICGWALLAMAYAQKESDAFLALFPDPSRQMSGWMGMVVFGAWMPLVFLALAVQRRREKRSSNQAGSSHLTN